MYYLTNEGLRVRGLADTSERPNPYGVRAAGGRGEKRTALIKKATEPPRETARKSAIQAKWKRPTTTPTFRERMKDAAINFKAGAAGAESVSDKNRTKAERLGSLYGGLKQKARDNVKGFVKGISTPADQHAAERKSIDRAAMSSAGDSRDPALRAMDSSPSDATDAAKMVARQGVKQTLGQEVGALTRNVGGKVRRAFGRTAKGLARSGALDRRSVGFDDQGRKIIQRQRGGQVISTNFAENSVYARIGDLLGETGRQVPGSPIAPATKKEKAVDAKIRATPGGQANIAAGSARAEKVIQNIRRGV